MMKPYIIGVAGGSASGKTTMCEKLFKEIGGISEASLIPLDSFYKELTPEEMKNVANKNFDHPDAMDWDLIKDCLKNLKIGGTIEIPDYNFVTCMRNCYLRAPCK